jgi:hypothetical protein
MGFPNVRCSSDKKTGERVAPGTKALGLIETGSRSGVTESGRIFEK